MADFEIQLGHLCNNRCVFCVSGALTHARAAPLLDRDALFARLREARAAGHDRLTLLGGEPTLQPHFLDVVREAVRLGFAPIVIFSNGSRPGRTDLVDRVAATGGRFEWRFSVQGATREAHERTTRRPGSFDQVLAAIERARALGHPVSVNTCVVEPNYRTLPEFPALLLSRGVRQLHVDMLSPYETGALLGPDKRQDVPEYTDLLRRRDDALPTIEDVRPLQPRYSDLVDALECMVAKFPVRFDVNIGNFPFCVAPRLAPHIHHGGQPTQTVTADDMGEIGLQHEKPKYDAKADLRQKPASCARCVYDDRCRGVYQAYRDWFGDGELKPVLHEHLATLDPARVQLALHMRPALERALRPQSLPAPFTSASWSDRDFAEITIETASASGERLVIALRRANEVGSIEASVIRAQGSRAVLAAAFGRLVDAIVRESGWPVQQATATVIQMANPRIAAAIRRLETSSPHGALQWRGVRLDAEGSRAECELATGAGVVAVVWIEPRGERLHIGYRADAADADVIEGLRRALATLGHPAASAARG